MKKSIGILLILAVITTLLAGCSSNSKFDPKENSIFLKKDGTMVSADIETFDKGHYSQEELAAFVEENVIEYNTEAVGLTAAYKDGLDSDLAVAIEKCEVNQQNAVLWLEYIHPDHYIAFNQETSVVPASIYIDTVENAQTAGYSFDVNFKKADGNSTTKDEVLKKENYHIGIIEGNANVQVEGKITFVSDNVTVQGENGATLTDGGIAYIIFK